MTMRILKINKIKIIFESINLVVSEGAKQG